MLSSRDGWVNIMYTGLDAVGVDQQVWKIRAYLIFNFFFFRKVFVSRGNFMLTLADRKLFGMAAFVLHIVHTAGWVFCAQHVRGRGSGKLSPVPGRAGKRRTGSTTGQTGQTDGKEAEE